MKTVCTAVTTFCTRLAASMTASCAWAGVDQPSTTMSTSTSPHHDARTHVLARPISQASPQSPRPAKASPSTSMKATTTLCTQRRARYTSRARQNMSPSLRVSREHGPRLVTPLVVFHIACLLWKSLRPQPGGGKAFLAFAGKYGVHQGMVLCVVACHTGQGAWPERQRKEPLPQFRTGIIHVTLRPGRRNRADRRRREPHARINRGNVRLQRG